jgi:adenylate kinase
MANRRGPRIVLLGKQGSGKGTQGARLAVHYGMQHLSTGQLFRDSAEVGVRAGLEAKEYMDRGELVPDELVVAVVEERFANPAEVDPGFVLDGFPRTRQQALELDRILGPRPLDIVIDLEVPSDVVVERMRARGREDDTEESIRRRLALYESETKPLVDFYRDRSLLVTIDGLGTEESVERALQDAIASRFGAP